MNHMRRRVLCLIVALALLAPMSLADEAAPPARRTPDEVLLVYNANSPISKSVAEDYARKRGVQNVISVQCVDSAVSTDNETIPFSVYTDSIETPIRQYLTAHPVLQFIVLTKGIPIRISGADTGCRPVDSAPDTPLNASLDGHLAAIGYADNPDAVKIKITGSGATGFGWSNLYWNANEPFAHVKFGGYLVARLDGYTEADAKALVTRALAAEHRLTRGKILLDVQPIFGLGDPSTPPQPIAGNVITDESSYDTFNAAMQQADTLLKTRGVSEELDRTEKFIGHRSGLLGYFSWGSNDAKFTTAAYESLTFAPGAICDTAVSTSGRTFLPTEGGQSLLADLLAHGLTCGKGYTDEPLLQGIASPPLVLDRYTSGWNMAESFYAASNFVGWQDVVVGDPLCCPYFARKPSK